MEDEAAEGGGGVLGRVAVVENERSVAVTLCHNSPATYIAE